jgi:predicted transcriptional regulator of viral defense system
MRNATVCVAELATRQWGVISRAQLARRGLSDASISRWVASGRLIRIHPSVYAVGHANLSIEGRLTAALLYAGEGAALSYATAAWWWRLIDNQPVTIDVTTPGRRSSIAAVRLHHPKHFEQTTLRGFPITTVPQTLLDFASKAPRDKLRRALAEADYRRLTNDEQLDCIGGRGHPGTAKLRAARRHHLPELARTKSPLEESFLPLLESHGIPLPEINLIVHGHKVDALWRGQRVIVELDGHRAHATPARIERDRRRDLELRAAGYTVLRYTWRQITQERATVLADLSRALNLPAPSAAPGSR